MAKNKTKVSDAGRGTFLIWERTSISQTHIVGRFQSNAGLYTKPRLYETKVNAAGAVYVDTGDYGRIYLTETHRNLHKTRKRK